MSIDPSRRLADLVEVNPRVDLRGLDGDTLVSFVPMADVSDSGEWTAHQERRLDDVRNGYTPFVENDVLFAKITPCMENGKGAHARGLTNGVGFGSTEFHVLRAKGENSARYVFHWLQAQATRSRAIAFMGGSAGQQRVHADFFSQYRISAVSPTVQRGIATVLDLADEAIAKTEAVIAKLKQVRAGLVHDLLTRGLDENGQLRDPVAHPERFKDSPVGRIPKEWSVLSIEALFAPISNPLRSGPFGSALLKQELRPTGIPLLGIDNVHVERFVANFSRFVDQQKFDELRRYAVRPEDLMITIMGTVGRCCVVPESIGVALSSKHVWTISLDRNRYSPDVACWQMNYAPWALRQLRRDEQGGVMTAIRSETLRGLLLPVPPPAELATIEAVLTDASHAIAAEETARPKLRRLKAGLMTDLLTGRVRVPPSLSGDHEDQS